jgi:hypothetical protein
MNQKSVLSRLNVWCSFIPPLCFQRPAVGWGGIETFCADSSTFKAGYVIHKFLSVFSDWPPLVTIA